MDTPMKFCRHCGAQISANAQFCKACGKSVGTQPAMVPPQAPAPSSNQAESGQPIWLIVGCMAVVAVIACVAVIAVGGFFFFQSTAQAPTTPTLIAILSPSTPTRVLNTVIPAPTLPTPAITPPPTIAATAPTMLAAIPTTAPTPTPTAAPTPTSAPTPKCPPTPALPAGVLFSDDFASRQVTECNGWDIKFGDNSDDIWAANQLTISPKRKQWVSTNEPDGEYADFGAETQAQPVGGNYAEYGLAFRDNDTNPSSYYVFGIRTDGKYFVSKMIADDWTDPDPVSETASPAIKPGAAQNTIGVIVQGGTISLYINRVLVKTFTDSSPLGKGRVGLMVATGDNDTAAVAFSKLSILTPDKAKADWGGAPAPAAPPVGSSSSQPQIIALEFPQEIPFDTNRYDGQIRFRDDGGDLQRVAFDAPPGSAYQPFGFEFTNPAVRWVEGNATSTSGVFKFSYACGQTSGVNHTFAVTLYDKAGNMSAPYPLSFRCITGSASNTLTVFFTIQNGSPTGYVIDKQGIKHTPPGYLTISDFHIAPGDRIVVQTDQPRFSLLFDCGTSPQLFSPCDFVADTPAALPAEIRKNANGNAYLNISRADNWAGTRSNFPSQRYPADPVLRIGFGD